MANELTLFDEIIHNGLLALRHAAKQAAASGEQLRKLEKQFIEKLSGEKLDMRQRRKLNRFFAEINKLVDERYKALQLAMDFNRLATAISDDVVTGFRLALGIDGVNAPKPDYLAALAREPVVLGAPASEWWRGQAEKTKFDFAQQVRLGLTAGETNQQIIGRIVGNQDKPGVMVTARRNAAALVQTSVQSVANEARRETYKANSDVVLGIKQVSTLDSHTSLICISYSECMWDLDFKPIGPKAKRKPYAGGCPRHMNCRSVEIPITKTFRQMGLDIDEPAATTRASDEGQISAKTTFNDFLNRKSKAYQEQMLGKGRADLWRAGKITLKDLVDGSNRPLSLDELEELVRQRARR